MDIDQGAGQSAIYAISLQGNLNESWSEWWNGRQLAVAHDEEGPTTTLIGPVADQAALRGLVNKLWDLNLVILSVVRVAHVDAAQAEEREEQSSAQRS